MRVVKAVEMGQRAQSGRDCSRRFCPRRHSALQPAAASLNAIRSMNNGSTSLAQSDDQPPSYRIIRRYICLVYAMVVIFLTIVAWGSDFFSAKGERTLYTARCTDGQWVKGHCTGRLESAERIRYKVQKSHSEVSYQALGSSSPVGHLARCTISNGRNWTCADDRGPPGSITLGLTNGKPDQSIAETTRTERCVSKWTWFRLRVAEKLS